jgi:hypothetical protein
VHRELDDLESEDVLKALVAGRKSKFVLFAQRDNPDVVLLDGNTRGKKPVSAGSSVAVGRSWVVTGAAVAPLLLPAPFGGLPVSAAICIEAIEEVDHRVDDVSVALGQCTEASAGAKRFPWLLTAFP